MRMFIHCVFFWLNQPSEESRRAMNDDAVSLLSNIPGVKHLWVGRPAMTPRDVVDNSYDIGICVVLDDAAAHDVYQAHRQHKEFGTRHKPNWKRLQVYDFH